MPGLIFALHVTNSLNVVVSPEHRREICRYIYNHQNEDGGWGTLILGSSSMFGTCSNYITLRLLGEEPNDEDSALAKGRAWILSHGGATLARRLFLARATAARPIAEEEGGGAVAPVHLLR